MMLSPFSSHYGEDPCTIETYTLGSGERASLSWPRVYRGPAGVAVQGTVDLADDFSFTEINPISK
jgi:hypothetical protein